MTTTTGKISVILSRPKDWENWIEIIQTQARRNGIWGYIDPNIEKDKVPELKKEEPETPQFIKNYAKRAGSASTSTANQNPPSQDEDTQSTIQVDPNPTASPIPTPITIPEPPTIRTLTDLEKDELQVYRREQALANAKFEKRQEAMEEMRSIIQQSIEATYLPYTYNCETPYDMLVKLKGVFAPKDYAKEQECIKEWDSLSKLKKGTELEAWLLKWETTYVKCKGLNLLETSGRRLIKTFLGAITSISLAFVDNWDNKLVDNPSKPYKFSMVI